MAASLRMPVGSPRGVAHDDAAGRVGRFAGDAGQLQGQGVGQRHVAVEPVDEDRMVRRDGVDQLARRQRGGRPVLVVPVAAEDPAALGQFRREVADAVAELGFAVRRRAAPRRRGALRR